jgi:hypothetical protein
MPQPSQSRAAIESQLAAAIVQQPKLFPAIDKLSEAILQVIEVNREYMNDAHNLTEPMSHMLYSDDNYGKLDSKLSSCYAPGSFVDIIERTLRDPSTALPLKLHIHQLFMMHVYDNLPIKAPQGGLENKPRTTWSEKIAEELSDNPYAWDKVKKSLVTKLFGNELFKSRSRVAKKKQPRSKKFGIASPAESVDVPSTYDHVRAAFDPVASSDWQKKITERELPFVSGPSGHTGSLLILAMLLGDLTPDEQRQYVTGIIGLLTGGGYHTIHEILAVAEKAGIGKGLDSGYAEILPRDFLKSDAFKQLQNKYDHLRATKEEAAAPSVQPNASLPKTRAAQNRQAIPSASRETPVITGTSQPEAGHAAPADTIGNLLLGQVVGHTLHQAYRKLKGK